MGQDVPGDQPASFETAAAYVVDVLEGGGTLITDQGGRTAWGISKRAHPDVDVEHLTRDQALAIYRSDYWSPIKADQLPAPFALALFDASVNLGPVEAVKLLQRVLRVPDDGVMGSRTLRAASKANGSTLGRFLALRQKFYEDLAASYPHHLPSLNGWRNRMFALALECGRWSARA